MTKAALVDLVAGLLALAWWLCASLPWALATVLGGLVHPGVAATFGLAALGRAYMAMRGGESK